MSMSDSRYPAFSRRRGPDLVVLIRAYGGYDKITAEAWQRFDKQSKWWTEWVREGGLHNTRVALSEMQRRR
jgi:hypothetical protein